MCAASDSALGKEKIKMKKEVVKIMLDISLSVFNITTLVCAESCVIVNKL